MANGETPFGLPRGSVKATLAWAILLMLGYSLYGGGEAPEILTTAVGFVLGYYFKESKSGD
jgi:hypothetical protein